MSYNNIPKEILYEIAKNFNRVELSKFAQIDENHRDVVSIMKPFGVIKIEKLHKSPPYLLTNMKVYIGEHVRNIELLNGKDVRSIHVDENYKFFKEEFFETNRHIEELSLKNCNIDDDKLDVISRTQKYLKMIDLSDNQFITNNGLNKLFKNNPRLVNVQIENLEITNKALVPLFKNNKIEVLDISGADDVDLENIKLPNSLRKISFVNTFVQLETIRKILEANPNMKYVRSNLDLVLNEYDQYDTDNEIYEAERYYLQLRRDFPNVEFVNIF